MAGRAAEREAADLQAARDREHARVLRAEPSDTGGWLTQVRHVMRMRASHAEELRRAGWKGKRDGWNAVANHVDMLINLLNDNPAPTIDPEDPDAGRPPLETIPPPDRHADLDPADGPISAQITDRVLTGGPVTPRAAAEIRQAIEAETDTDAKLDAAFSPRPALAGPDEPAAPWITAAFDGRCSECGQRIDAGDDIRADGAGGWQGRECCGRDDDDAVRYVAPRSEQRPVLMSPDPFAVPVDLAPRRRLSLIEVAGHGRARARGGDHRSHSQITGFEECGVRYALSDRERRPAWWNVGGNALHSAIETINRVTQHKGVMPADALDDDTSQLWGEVFRRTVAETEHLSGVPHDQWRAASQGAEAYDWWRVEGEMMVDRWVDYLRRRYEDGWTIAGVEQEWRLPVDGIPVPVLCVLDAVFERDGDELTGGARLYDIIDIKAGKRPPGDNFQIGGLYHWALWHGLNTGNPEPFALPDGPEIAQSFWLARWTNPVNQTIEVPTVPWPDVVHRVSMMDRAERQGLYLARQSIFCGSCEVGDLCPVGPS